MVRKVTGRCSSASVEPAKNRFQPTSRGGEGRVLRAQKKKERKKGKRGGVGRIKEKIGAFNSKAREEKRTWGGKSEKAIAGNYPAVYTHDESRVNEYCGARGDTRR